MEILVIGGAAMPTPSRYEVLLSDVDSENSGRSETGYLFRDRVRAGMAKISVAWEMLSTEECVRVLAALTPDTLQVSYFFGSARSAVMYAGDRSIEMIYGDPRTGDAMWNVSVNLTEY